MTKTIDQLVATAEFALVDLQTATVEDVLRVALEFGFTIGDIGRAMTLNPELVPAVRAFVERTAPIIQRGTGLLHWFGYVYDAAESRSEDPEDYIQSLMLRSDLEFFRELYRDSVASSPTTRPRTSGGTSARPAHSPFNTP